MTSLAVGWWFLAASLTSPVMCVEDTEAPTTAPLKYYYGNNLARILPWESASVLVTLAIIAVVMEYLLARLKAQDGTYARIVATSVLQETLIIGLVSMFLLGILTVVGIKPLYVLCVRSTSAGLIMMIFVFIVLVLLLTVGLLWNRRVWGSFERTRMAAENIRGGIKYQRRNASSRGGTAAGQRGGDDDEIVNRDDDEDEKHPSTSGAPASGGIQIASAVRRYTPSSSPSAAPQLAASVFDAGHTPSRFHSPGAQSPRTPGSPSAGGGQIPLSSRLSVGGRGGDGGGAGALIHRPLPASAMRAPLVLPYDLLHAEEQDALDRELADALLGDGPLSLPSSLSPNGEHGGGRRRKMVGFSTREKIFARCRDLWMETLIRKRLLNRQQRTSQLGAAAASAADIRDDNELFFTEYVWKLMPHIMSLQADLGWKAWMVLALFIVVDGVRAVIVLGDNTEVTTEVLLTSVASFVFLGGVLPLCCFLLLMLRVQSGLDRFSRKPLMRQHEREAQPRMASSQQELFFGELEASSTIFQLVLLVFEWYGAFFYLNFSQPIVDTYGSVSLLFFLGAMAPVVIYLTQMPWMLTMIAILSGLGSDVSLESVQAMKDDLRLARGELTEVQQQQLEEYERDLPGEWNLKRNVVDATTGAEIIVSLHGAGQQHDDDDDANAQDATERREQRPRTVRIAPKATAAVAANSSGVPTSTAAQCGQERERLKPPPPAFFSFLPPDRILPGEEHYFRRFASPPRSAAVERSSVKQQPSGAMFVDSDDDDDYDL